MESSPLLPALSVMHGRIAPAPDSYLRTVHRNLQHLRALRPPAPKPNLAESATGMPMTEDDVYLNQRIHWGSIPEGRPGTQQTMQTMARLAREATRDPVFVEFIRQFGTLNDLETWMREHFTYRDEHEELIRTPRFMLADMGRTSGTRIVGLEGDCDDAATFLSAAAKAMGYSARLVAIRYHRSNPDFEHVFAQALDQGQWVTLDPTVEVGTTIQSIEDMIVPV